MRSTTEAPQLVAEFLGTALLLAAIVGSGITAATDGSASAQLFQHTVVVGAALAALILMFGPVSGAHFNPAVTVADWWFGGLAGGRALRYVAAQLAGAVAGTVLTHLTFGLPGAGMSATTRDGLGMVGGEAIATAGLLLVIFALVRTQRFEAVPGAVGLWIGAAIYFTSSAAFANPAVTLARALTDTYTGIAPTSVPAFLAGQALGAVVAVALIGWLYAPAPSEAADVVVPHDDTRPPRTEVPS